MVNPLAYPVPFITKERTRYYWKVYVEDETGDSAWSETAWFETALPDWKAKWISPIIEGSERQPILYTNVSVKNGLRKARMYMTGVGLYELYIGNVKIGDEYFMPGYNGYDSWIQYQT